VFQWLQQTGGIADHELRRTFNCGIGFVVIADPAHAPAALTALLDGGEQAWVIGELRAG